MEKRIYPRLDVLPRFVQINIILHNHDVVFGRLKDISRGGMSFYTEIGAIEDIQKVVFVWFDFDGNHISLEFELLRTKNATPFESLHAGRFKGVLSGFEEFVGFNAPTQSEYAFA